MSSLSSRFIKAKLRPQIRATSWKGANLTYENALDHLRNFFTEERSFSRKGPFLLNDDAVAKVFIVEEGVVEQYTSVSHRKQAVSLHYSGESFAHWFPRMRLRGLTSSKLRFADANSISEAISDRPEIASLLRTAIQDQLDCASKWLEVITKSSESRLAHFLCEQSIRSEPNKNDDGSFNLFSQEDYANVLALTTVHINRLFGKFEDDRLIVRQGKRVQITDWGELARLGHFNAMHLQYLRCK